MPKPTKILLYELSGIALIIPANTGVVYRNQSGGYSCYQTEAEGYLVPLAGDKPEITKDLSAYFTGPKWGGWCSHGIDDETANVIDGILTEAARRNEIKVDRDKLGDSFESWIHVKIDGPLLSLIENSSPSSAILTWPNSD